MGIYEPHIVVVWIKDTVAVKEFAYKEDAEVLYQECISKGIPKVALAKIVKEHGEG